MNPTPLKNSPKASGTIWSDTAAGDQYRNRAAIAPDSARVSIGSEKSTGAPVFSASSTISSTMSTAKTDFEPHAGQASGSPGESFPQSRHLRPGGANRRRR